MGARRKENQVFATVLLDFWKIIIKKVGAVPNINTKN
jgi:hypothetical protein